VTTSGTIVEASNPDLDTNFLVAREEEAFDALASASSASLVLTFKPFLAAGSDHRGTCDADGWMV
jgi:hypothetical protein